MDLAGAMKNRPKCRSLAKMTGNLLSFARNDYNCWFLHDSYRGARPPLGGLADRWSGHQTRTVDHSDCGDPGRGRSAGQSVGPGPWWLGNRTINDLRPSTFDLR